VADLEMRLIGTPDEVAAVADEFRTEFANDPILKRISEPLPGRKNPGQVRVYVVLDGTLLSQDLRS
jgi:hypothetical protein